MTKPTEKDINLAVVTRDCTASNKELCFGSPLPVELQPQGYASQLSSQRALCCPVKHRGLVEQTYSIRNFALGKWITIGQQITT